MPSLISSLFFLLFMFCWFSGIDWEMKCSIRLHNFIYRLIGDHMRFTIANFTVTPYRISVVFDWLIYLLHCQNVYIREKEKKSEQEGAHASNVSPSLNSITSITLELFYVYTQRLLSSTFIVMFIFALTIRIIFASNQT